MIEALIGGETDPQALAALAHRRIKATSAELEAALRGRVTKHHRFALRLLLQHIDAIDAAIAEIDQEVDANIEPFRTAITILKHDPWRQPTQRRGHRRRDRRRHGAVPDRRPSDLLGRTLSEERRERRQAPVHPHAKGAPWLKTTLIQCAWAATRTKGTYLQAQFHRLRARRGAKKAIGAVAASILTAAYHMLRTGALYQDLGAGHFDHRAKTTQIAYMRGADLPQAVIDTLADHASLVFGSREEWMGHLRALGLADLRVTPDPVRAASEAALMGAIEAEGLLGQAVIVSDDAGQFRLGDHALCLSPRPKRLVHKLLPANDKQSNAVAVAKRMIWWFYRRLKAYKLAPSAEQARLLRAQFDRIFNRRTGYATLERLLKRLFGRKDELLRVLERPEIPLNTNASENDIRAFVTKRKISGGTVSENGRQARDVMLGLAKTCRKLKIPFFDYLGARLGIPGPEIPHLATLVSPAPS